ncbi:DUF500-domain-containing protein [Cristinia sonorae]|uniref:DUF500-domain-containing protein n=1 Tax=Cristinia sonorae TaxID=1940300 RepID=A0A8K0URJ2_9AGAR|nr:DUF500-domain-containing protein [Cristinia sonorae]
MKFNNPLPQALPKECQKAAKIFRSFVDGANNGLDGVIPRSILENARGFAIFTVFKAGFVFSARAGSGVVIARLDDGTWSPPSAIGTAGLGLGSQVGAEMTDFLVVLNSRSAVRSFMSAGSLTLGGNLSIAVGPLGRNGEATGSVNTSGKMAAMYSYSKARGLFCGISLEGSVIVERQDANAIAYNSDVSARMILSGSVTAPDWAQPLLQTLEDCTGMPGGRKWVNDLQSHHASPGNYIFGGAGSPGSENGPTTLKKDRPGYFRHTSSSSLFDFSDRNQGTQPTRPNTKAHRTALSQSSVPKQSSTPFFDTQFETDFVPEDEMRKHPKLTASPGYRGEETNDDPFGEGSPFQSLPPTRSSLIRPGSDSSHRRSMSAYTPTLSTMRPPASQERVNSYSPPPSDIDYLEDLDGRPPPTFNQASKPKLQPKTELTQPLKPSDGVARAIALYDFNAVQDGDLSFSKGQVITVKYMSKNTDTWWLGRVDGREGIFPANFVEVV